MRAIREIKESFLHLLFPHICSGCGTDLLNKSNLLCLRCLNALPATDFEWFADNPVEKIFRGRLKVKQASAQFYFTKESLMQQLMHQFKYKGNKELGLQLGKIMGDQIKNSRRFPVDAIVPLPLFSAKERKRGFNQATILCEGMADILNIPVLDNAVKRIEHTDTQTKKGRIERWVNMENKFELTDASLIKNRHLLLVDDVITTGATLEACGLELLKEENVELSIVTLCIASRS